MSRVLAFCILILNCAVVNSMKHQAAVLIPLRQFNAGLDFSQFNYYLDREPNGLNAAAFVQYKPYYFLGLNASLGYNDVKTPRGQGFNNLQEYHSQGAWLKLGGDLSLRLGIRRRDTRAFIGGQAAIIRYRESGHFLYENYWGEYVYPFKTPVSTVIAGEFICGLQFKWRRCILRTQIYTASDNDDRRISHKDEVIDGYRSPFIPGLGYMRGGINLILVYRIKERKINF